MFFTIQIAQMSLFGGFNTQERVKFIEVYKAFISFSNNIFFIVMCCFQNIVTSIMVHIEKCHFMFCEEASVVNLLVVIAFGLYILIQTNPTCCLS